MINHANKQILFILNAKQYLHMYILNTLILSMFPCIIVHPTSDTVYEWIQ